MDADDDRTIKETAHDLGISRHTAERLFHEGTLTGTQVGGPGHQIRVSGASIDHYLLQRPLLETHRLGGGGASRADLFGANIKGGWSSVIGRLYDLLDEVSLGGELLPDGPD